MKKEKVHEIFTRLYAKDPEPKTELFYTNDYTLLVAIVLSAQATDIGVNKATPALFDTADTPQKMVNLGVTKLKNYIKTIGLFNSKAQNIITLSETLISQYNGKIPETHSELIKLAGVGSKTANIWLNCARGKPTIAVDTHVFRVANRLGLCKTKTAEATETALANTIPDIWKLHAHHWLILHGRYICKARNPICNQCILSDLCPSANKSLT